MDATTRDARPLVRTHDAVLVRLRSGAVVVLLALGLAWLGGYAWWAAVTVVAVAGAAEALGLARAGGLAPDRPVGLALAGLLVVSAAAPGAGPLRLVLAGGVAAAFAAQLWRPAGTRSAGDWMATVAGPAAVGALAGYLAAVRALPDGLAWTLALWFLVWSNDSGAYVGGHLFGRTPLCPTISPHKTREGTISGTAATVGLALLLPAIGAWGPAAVAPWTSLTPWGALLLGLAVSAAAPLGDLSVSFLKREAGVKDTGHLIPGHGGVLDRVDSVLFAAPVLYHAAVLLGAVT